MRVQTGHYQVLPLSMPLLVRCTELTVQEDDHKCQSYTYMRDRQECVLSEDRINYDPEYDYYENKQRVDGDPAELSDETKKRKLVERDEELAARKAKRLRLKMESKEREEKLAATEAKSIAARVAAEAKEKMRAKKEVQAKADELTMKQEASNRAAREQGEYLESVQKASRQVRHASQNVKKEREAKQVVSSRKMTHKKEKQKEEAREEKYKITKAKNVSRNKHKLSSTKDSRTHLRIRQRTLELYTKATLLATQQRLSTGQELPGERARLDAESKLSRELAVAKNNVVVVQGQVKEITLSITEKRQLFKQNKIDRGKLYAAKMNVSKKQSEDKLQNALDAWNHRKLEKKKKEISEKADKKDE